MENFKILVKWLIFYFLGIIFGKKFPHLIYFLCMIGFLTGFILRILKIYPGKHEPIYLDGVTFLISICVFFYYKYYKQIDIKYGLLLIFLLHILFNLFKIFVKFY